jgi:hypothetical protein
LSIEFDNQFFQFGHRPLGGAAVLGDLFHDLTGAALAAVSTLSLREQNCDLDPRATLCQARRRLARLCGETQIVGHHREERAATDPLASKEHHRLHQVLTGGRLKVRSLPARAII